MVCIGKKVFDFDIILDIFLEINYNPWIFRIEQDHSSIQNQPRHPLEKNHWAWLL